MRINRPTLNIASVAITAIAVATIGAPQAQADPTEYCTHGFKIEGVSCFYSYGDRISVNDISPDGLRTVAEIVVDGGIRRECHDSNGAGNGLTWCDFDFPESRQFSLRTVARNGANGDNVYVGPAMFGSTSGR